MFSWMSVLLRSSSRFCFFLCVSLTCFCEALSTRHCFFGVTVLLTSYSTNAAPVNGFSTYNSASVTVCQISALIKYVPSTVQLCHELVVLASEMPSLHSILLWVQKCPQCNILPLCSVSCVYFCTLRDQLPLSPAVESEWGKWHRCLERVALRRDYSFVYVSFFLFLFRDVVHKMHIHIVQGFLCFCFL